MGNLQTWRDGVGRKRGSRRILTFSFVLPSSLSCFYLSSPLTRSSLVALLSVHSFRRAIYRRKAILLRQSDSLDGESRNVSESSSSSLSLSSCRRNSQRSTCHLSSRLSSLSKAKQKHYCSVPSFDRFSSWPTPPSLASFVSSPRRLATSTSPFSVYSQMEHWAYS